MNVPVSLSPELIAKAQAEATHRGISISDFIRESVEVALTKKISDDPLIKDDAVFDGEEASDLASNHDDYLYGDAS